MSDQNNNFNSQQPQYVDPQQPYAQPGYAQPGYPQAAMPPQYAQPGYPQAAMPPQYAQPGYPQATMPPQYAQPGYPQAAMPPQYAQPGYPQAAMPPQYAQPGYPQPAMPYGQPQYYAAPQPVYDAPAPAEEPEVVLQETPFADFGFGEEDSVGSGHNFGGFMEDDNTEPAVADDFNAFNAQTPNFDPAAVEAASKIEDNDKAMFTSTTPNLDVSAVEAASKTTSDEDRDIFSNSMAVGEREQTVSEAPSFDAASSAIKKEEPQAVPMPETPPTFTIAIEGAPTMAEIPTPVVEQTPAAPAAPSSFMASMAAMMSSLNNSAAPASVPTEVPSAAPAQVPTATSIPEEPTSPVFSQPDVVVNATSAQTVQDISSTSTSDEKSEDYWKNIDKMLNNFDDGQYHQDISNPIHIEEKKTGVAAPAMPAAPQVNSTQEAETRFPFSESAQATKSAPVAQTPVAQSAAPVNTAPVAPSHIPQQFAQPVPVPAQQVAVATPAQQVATNLPQSAPQTAPSKREPVMPAQPAVAAQPVAPVVPLQPMPAYATPSATAVPIEEPVEEEVLDKKAAREAARAERDARRAEERAQRDAEKAAKAEEKAAAKAAKAEARAAKKASKNEKVEENFGDAQPKGSLRPTAEAEPEEDYDRPSGFKGIIYTIFPNKNDKVFEIVRKVIALVSVLALLVCGIYFLVTFINSKSHEKSSEELSKIMSTSESTSQEWENIYTKYPSVQFPTGMQIKFADLYAINQDLAGWIKISGLGIDYPVMQTTDDSYYLKHDFYKQSSAYGTIFMSARNSLSYELDQNTVIYGHAMRRDKQMFSRLHDYKDRQTFIENPIIEFNTLYGNYKFKVYCVFITNGSTADDNGYLLDYTFTNLSSEESFAGFIGELSLRELYHTGVDIAPTDKIICLSTCSYEFDNARFVVVGRLLRDGESEEIDSSKVTDNQSENGIRYPQAYYDAKGKTNPYAKYTHWQPNT